MTAASVVECFIPVIWLCFSLSYSRSGYREYLKRWGVALAAVGLLPIALWLVSGEQLLQVVPVETPGAGWRLQFGPTASLLNVVLLVALVLILVNLEQTFRSAVGTMRWRIKYVVLAMVVIFGARVYVSSQAILFSAPNIGLWGVKSGALFIGCLFLTLAYTRTGWREIDVHPSSAVLRSSVTVVIVGGISVHRRCAGARRATLRRRRVFSAAGVCGAAGHGRPGRAAAIRSRAPATSSIHRPAFPEGAARFGPHLELVLPKPGQGDRSAEKCAPSPRN